MAHQRPTPDTALLPLGALLLAASAGTWAQTTPEAGRTLPTVTVRDEAEVPQTKNDLRVRRTQIGKGNQELKDIPQSVTIQTERLMDDRNLDDFREVLKTTAGVTFQAGETGEEDVRLRGFSLQQAGDIYRDGLRDAPLYERDTFNDDRIEVLKGSASMLFGKGSTGGIVNQVSKQPFLMDSHEIDYTIGTGAMQRLTGDFNFKTGEDSAFRLNAMVHNADNYGARQEKLGIAPGYRWGIGTRDEYSLGLYHLEIDGRPLYNHPQLLSNGNSGDIVLRLPSRNYYGLANDHLDTQADYATFSHVHRFDANEGQVRTLVRHGRFQRDLLASAISYAAGTTLANLNNATVLNRTPKARIGVSDLTQVTSDYSGKFDWGGRKHELIAGVDAYQDKASRNNSATAGLAPSPPTTVGTPDDGAVRADTRGAIPMNTFRARDLGMYAQDVVALTPTIKAVGGLRFDHFTASYRLPSGVETSARSENLWSPRVGLLYQPSALASYYVSYGTSYNVSADTYQFTPAAPANTRAANTPAEKSRNFEIGGKWELFEKRALVGVAAFHSEKYNERNTDPDSAATQELLSGRRHASGLEFNLAGRINPKWEMFFNHTWIPDAKIDESNVAAFNCTPLGVCTPNNAQRQGDRPGLTPVHSGSLWSTYRILPKFRIGGGVNYRSSQKPDGARHVNASGFATFDAMAEYTYSEQLILKLNVTNLADKQYADSLYRGFYIPGATRKVELSVKTLF